jgi:hypothetical protein
MEYYVKQRLGELRKFLYETYNWDTKYQFDYEEEIGNYTLYHFILHVEGQYAEDDAENAIADFGVYSVSVNWTDHSEAELRVTFDA